MIKRALVIGVAQYIHKRLEQPPHGRLRLVDKDMPSALRDAERMSTLLTQQGFEVRQLVGVENTTRAAIWNALRVLFSRLGSGDVVVIYYSGHCARINARGLVSDEVDGKDEVLATSDTDWETVYIKDDDLNQLACAALDRGARLEIILETCSATGLQDQALKQRQQSLARPFGNLARFGAAVPLLLPAESCVIWSATNELSASYAGPDDPKNTSPAATLGGLFTKFFIEHFRGHSNRKDLIDKITQALAAYRKDHLAACPDGPGSHCMDPVQVPRLDCFGSAALNANKALAW